MTSSNNTTSQAFHTFDLDPRAALQAAINSSTHTTARTESPMSVLGRLHGLNYEGKLLRRWAWTEAERQSSRGKVQLVLRVVIVSDVI
jgi:hypothetical protein